MTVIPNADTIMTLNPKSRILISGAGGGYDFLCGLPIGLSLRALGHKVFFGNNSFTNLGSLQNSNWISPHICEVNEVTGIQANEYFPEGLFAKWWKEHFDETCPVFCFPQIGIKSMTESFNFLNKFMNLDTLIVIDGGVDGIMRGDEYDLATPSMDSISIISGSLSNFEKKFFSFTAFGSEGLPGEISHAQVLGRIADLIRSGNMIGVASYLGITEIGRTFIQAINQIYRTARKEHQSNMVSSVISAISGNFGWKSVNAKTEERKMWISPLTLLYWYFNLTAVAKLKLYYEAVLTTDSVKEVNSVIEKLRANLNPGSRETIPI